MYFTRCLNQCMYTFSITAGYSRYLYGGDFINQTLIIRFFIAGKECLSVMPTGFSWLCFSFWCTSSTQQVMSHQTTRQTAHLMPSQENNQVSGLSWSAEFYLRKFPPPTYMQTVFGSSVISSWRVRYFPDFDGQKRPKNCVCTKSIAHISTNLSKHVFVAFGA